MFKRFTISLLIPGTPVGPETLALKALGEPESAGLYLARALAREGASVNVFCNAADVWADETGACYLPLEAWPEFAGGTPHDVCIVQGSANAFARPTTARLNLLWGHEPALAKNCTAFCDYLWNVDRIVLFSRYALEQYKHAYDLDDEAFFVSRSAVDVDSFNALASAGVSRDPRKLVSAVRPEEGLDVLLRHVMPKLFARDGELRLYLASDGRTDPQFREHYLECKRLAAQFGARVVQLGSLSKRELYHHYMSARVYLQPTSSAALARLRDVSCTGARECQAAGLPIVATALGALPEAIAPGAGLMIDADPSDRAVLPKYVERFVDAVLQLVADDSAWSSASERALARGRELDWSEVASEWLAEFERLIRARNDSPARLVRHFLRTADIVAAKRVLATASEPRKSPRSSWDRNVVRLLTPWSFIDQPDGYDRQYELVCSTRDDWMYETPAQEPRALALRNWLMEQDKRISTVLDVGCGGGARTLGLARRLPHLRIHGVDGSSSLIDAARDWARRLRVGDRATFSVWGGDEQISVGAAANLEWERFDCGLLQHVLERVPEPWAVLERAERQVRRGGRVYLSVPFGTWEINALRSDEPRLQVWNFDDHDLEDMIGAKPDLSMDCVHAGHDSVTGEPLGWWIASYTADHAPVPPIDLERHLWLQRPRSTVSAAILAGPEAQDTLAWSLRSIEGLADEIVVADFGMSNEARRLAHDCCSDLVESVDPYVAGFERARNTALAACSGDFCLWLDTHERLVHAQALTKYLRDNGYHAYRVTQHRFACDSELTPEAAVRLFRTRPYRGRTVQFWGAAHETAELGVDEGAGPTFTLPDVHVADVGALDPAVRQVRLMLQRRLLELDRTRYPERLRQKRFILRDNMQLVREELSRNGGRTDAEIRAKCRETVEIYQKYFLGRTYSGARDDLRCYSDALLVLGEGFEAVFQLEVDRVEAKPNGTARYRFASLQDFQAELRRAVDEKARHFDTTFW